MAGKRKSKRYAAVGTAPGTLSPDQNASPTSIRLTVVSGEQADCTENARVEDVGTALEGTGWLWVDVTGLSDIATLSSLAELFSIDPLALEDVVNTDQRPKAESYEKQALIIVQMFSSTSTHSREQFSILFDKRNVVTFQERPGDCLDPVRKRLAQPKSRLRSRGPAYLAYALLDTIFDFYFPLLEHLGESLEGLEDRITNEPEPDCLNELHALKRQLLVIKRALWPAREMLSTLTRGELGFVPKGVGQYLRDLNDHIVQLIDMTESYRELSSSLYDLYQSTLSARMNEVMKVLTIVSTVFIPLSFMAGLWGMNFDPSVSPWNMPELGAYYGYPVALACMAAVGGVLLGFFWWKKWL